MAERVGAVDPGQHGRVAHHRQHLARHLDDDLIGIAIGEHPRQRSAPRHSVAARIVDDDEVDPARLLAFGGEAGAGAATQDRLACFHHRPEPLHQCSAIHACHLNLPPARRETHPARHPRKERR